MTINEIIQWYDENTDAKLNEQIIQYMLKIGIINDTDNLDHINLRLLAKYNNKPVVINSKYKVKDNIKELIEYFNSQKQQETKPTQKFKIEKINGKKMKLIRK